MKDCNNCELKKFPACANGIPCCRCDNQSCNSRQPCPHQEVNCQSDFDTIKVDIPLTMEEKLVLSDKTGYSPASIDRIIRGYSPVLPRHQRLVELYKKMMHLKQLHHENYITDINSL